MIIKLLTIILFFGASLTNGQNNLYYLCKNEINFDSSNYKVVSISGADSITLEGKFFLIPTENQVIVKCLEDNIERNMLFMVMKAPYPEIKVYLPQRTLADSNGLVTKKNFYIKAIPNKDFALNYPKECRYRVTDFKLEVYRNGSLIDIKNRMSGDILRVTVNEIERTNFRNQKEKITDKKTFNITID